MTIASIYEDLIYREDRPVVTVLFETDFTKELRIAMKAGVTMKEHKSSFPIVVQVVKGQVNFGVSGTVQLLSEGSLIALEGNVLHDLFAKEDSVVRLTLAKSDEARRVQTVVNQS